MADLTTDTHQMTRDEAIKIIYLARHAASEKTFTLFQKGLADEKIPWSLSDPRFLEKVQELKNTLITELNLQNEKQASRAAEESFSRSLSEEDREGMTRGFEQIQQQEKANRQDLFKHTETLVDTYVDQLKKRGPFLPEQESTIRNSVSKAAQQTINQGNLSDVTKQMALAAGTYVSKETASSAATTLELSPEALETENKMAQLTNITKTALTSDDAVQTGTLIDRCLSNPDTDPELLANKNNGELKAEKIFSLSEGVQGEIDNALNDPRNRRVAFEKAATSVKQGVSLPVNDIITAVGGPQGKEFISSVIDTVLGTSSGEANTNGTVGGQTVKTNAFSQQKIQQMEESLAQRETARSGSRYVPNKSLVSSAAALWRPQIQEGFRVYLETATFKASINAPEYFQYFILAGTDVWNALLGRATRRVAGEAVKKAGGVLLKKGAEKAAGAAIGATAGGVLGGIPGAILGWIAQKVIGKGLSVVWGGIKGLFSFLQFGEIAKGIMGGFGAPQKPKPWYQQDSWVLAIICVIGLLFCTGMTFTREVATTAAIVAEKDKTTTIESKNRSIDLFEKIPDHPTEQNGVILNFTTHCIENPIDPRCAVVSPPPQGVFNFKADKTLSGYCASGGGKITNWKQAASERVISAITKLETSQVFAGLISTPQGEQEAAPINIYYVEGSGWIGGCYDGNIYLYGAGGSSDTATLYTLAHELGHALADRQPDIYDQFIASRISSKQMEGWLPTYPFKDAMSDREDFAETVAMYSSNYKKYPSGFINHYNFAASLFGETQLR